MQIHSREYLGKWSDRIAARSQGDSPAALSGFVGPIRACKRAGFRDNSRFLAKSGRDAGRAVLMPPSVAAGLLPDCCGAGLF
jgi:hypothetical protein